MYQKKALFVVVFTLSLMFVSAQNSSFYVGFKSGVYLGSKKSAVLYNGTSESYGIKRIYKLSNLEAVIAEELIYPFELSEAPLNIKYNPALSIGGTLGWILENENAVFLSVDIINLNIEDAYTVKIDDPNELEPVIRPFAIIGKENRLNFDLGYKAFFDTKSEKLRPYINIGINALYTEYVNNQIYIGNLGPYNIYPEGFQLQNAKKSGFGLGGLGGLGINYVLTNSTSIDIEYSLKYSTVNYGLIKYRGPNHAISLSFNWGK